MFRLVLVNARALLGGQEKGRKSCPMVGVDRLYARYQFKRPKPFYYPDRKEEAERKAEAATKEIVEMENSGLRPKNFCYKVLGVSKYATIEEIRDAYLVLAKRYYPDVTRSKRALNQFQEISNSYRILTDANKRLEYDHSKNVAIEKALSKPPKKLRQKWHKTKQLQSAISANEEEATLGCNKLFDLWYLRKCEKCGGTPQLLSDRDVEKEPCRRCHGTGKVFSQSCGTHADILSDVEMLVIKSKGVRRNGVGKRIDTVKVFVPHKLSAEQRLLILALAETEDPIF
ncbi:chaperone protein DnaJ-like [Drosophila pseudoobscura]|uniref:Chaperone protein DnaJ-like n=1 Tax=Drosophila pseudoobscura pseudoobscura TaxID=46245 RepID=A0A6I8V315_DROPS|nr:chaperone protein DnaJ [Drosophila pseudoobscura]